MALAQAQHLNYLRLADGGPPGSAGLIPMGSIDLAGCPVGSGLAVPDLIRSVKPEPTNQGQPGHFDRSED